MRRLTALLALTITLSPGSLHAEDPLDWYAALRRTAKYGAISSQGGNSLAAIKPYAEEAAQLGPRIDTWSKAPGRDRARATCLNAVRQLQAALKLASANDRYVAIRDGEPLRDDCQRDIWGQ